MGKGKTGPDASVASGRSMRAAGRFPFFLAVALSFSGCWSVARLDSRRGSGTSLEIPAPAPDVLEAAKQHTYSTDATYTRVITENAVYVWFNDIFGGMGEAIFISPTDANGRTKTEAVFASAGVDERTAEKSLLDVISKTANSQRAPVEDKIARASGSPAPSRPSFQAPSEPAAPARARPDVDEPAFPSRPENADDFAIVVGVESYQKSLPKASFAERDAQAMARYLRALGVPPRQMKVLVGSDATSSALRGYLTKWLPKNVKPDSRVFFYFSGHGAPDPETGSAYLVPWDGNPDFLDESAVSLDDLYRNLGALGAKQVLVALDSCFSGAGGRSVLKQGARPLVTVVSPSAVPANLTVMTASRGNQITGTSSEQGHGIFTYYLLKGLNQGVGSSRRLCQYLQPKVADEAALANGDQNPECRGPDFSF